jgi:Metal-independent alpha-mannosidase (GH125)
VERLTAADETGRQEALQRLEATIGADGLVHESVHADDPRRWTRGWFSWADMLYVELVLASVGVELHGESASLRFLPARSRRWSPSCHPTNTNSLPRRRVPSGALTLGMQARVDHDPSRDSARLESDLFARRIADAVERRSQRFAQVMLARADHAVGPRKEGERNDLDLAERLD